MQVKTPVKVVMFDFLVPDWSAMKPTRTTATTTMIRATQWWKYIFLRRKMRELMDVMTRTLARSIW